MKILGSITGEGFTAAIREDAGRVWFTADADIDADGANGQNGARAAYRADNKGSESLANGGMKISGNKVICAKPWARDIVILGRDNQPRIFPGGIIASRTWYKHPGKAIDDPAAYLDSETENYIVVPPLIVQRTAGVVRGCKALVTWRGRQAFAVVGDLGPRNRVGEISIALARELGIPCNPRTGGIEAPEVLYELWPGTAAPGHTLQPA